MALLLSGLRHARSIGGFREELHAHQLIPSGLRPSTALAVTVAELLLGITFSARLALDPDSFWQVWAFVGAFSLLWIFSLYLIMLLRRRPGVPCGCGIGTADVSSWHLVRNGLLLLMVSLSYFQPPSVWSLLNTPERLVVILSGISFTATIYLLPQALIEPSANPRRGGANLRSRSA